MQGERGTDVGWGEIGLGEKILIIDEEKPLRGRWEGED